MGAESEIRISDEIHVLGNEVLKSFQDEIMEILEKFLSAKWGEDWLTLCTVTDSEKFVEVKKDLQFTLKQIVQKNNGNFRLALSHEIFNTDRLKKEQLDALARIQEFRNLWAHPESELMTLTALRKLASSIIEFYGNIKNNLVEYCNFILSFKESDGEAIPKILVNSSIFKRHLSSVDNIMKNIDENSNLMGKIIDLNKKLEEYKKNGVDGNSLIPGYLSMTYDDLLEASIVTSHMVKGFLGAYYVMNLKLAVANMRLVIQIKECTENKKTKLAIEKWEDDYLKTFDDGMKKVMEHRSSIVFPDGCDCRFCAITDPSKIGAMASIAPIEVLIEAIIPRNKK